MLKKKGFLILLLAFSSYFIFGQESDFQTWYNIELNGRLFKKIDYSISPEIRAWDNSSRIETMYAEISLSVPIAKYFDLGVTYRPELDISEVYPHKINRFCIFGDASYKIKRFKVSYRGIYQQEYTDYNTSEEGYIPKIQHRHKMGLKFNPRKSDISPFVSSEAFITLKPLNDTEKWKLRTSFGFEYKINKNLNGSVAYKIERVYNTKNPLTNYIISFSLEYDL
jgi:hypothetical protein